jgi:hypothetical protein
MPMFWMVLTSFTSCSGVAENCLDSSTVLLLMLLLQVTRRRRPRCWGRPWANIRGFRLFPSSCPLRTSHFRYTSKFEMTGDLHAHSEIAGDMHAQSRLETGWVCTR